MGGTLTTWSPSCNGFVRVEQNGERTTSDSGALLLREALDNSGVIEALEDHLVDRRDPLRIRHSLASQLRTVVLQRAMGWIDLSDIDTLRRDPLWQLACSDARGTTPLAQGGSDYHGHVGARIYSPLIASLAETGDMLGGLLREGNAGPAENADT